MASGVDIDLSMVCRACLKEPADCEIYELSLDIRDLFEKCTNISLAEDVDSPSLICSRCWDRCENWQDFRRMSQLNDARIRHKRGTAKPQIQPKRDSEEASPILLVFPKEEVPEVDDGDNDYFEDFNGDEQEAGEEEEPTEDPIGDALDCPICPDQFYNDQLYESHIRGHYIFAKSKSCLVCSKEFASINSAVTHTFEHGNLTVNCEFCQKPFKGRSKLRVHKNKYHKIVLTVDAAAENEQSHESTTDHSLKCPVCHEVVQEVVALTNHIEEHFEGDQIPCCKLCKHSLPTIASAAMHHNECLHSAVVAKASPRKKTKRVTKDTLDILDCPVCGANLDDEPAYNHHIKSHYSLTDRKCQLCGDEFPGNWALINHTHEHGSRQIPCGYCDKVYNTRHKQTQHINKYHREQRDADKAEQIDENDDEAEVQCEHCGDILTTSKDLAIHMKRSHPEAAVSEDILMCENCSRVFATHDEWEAHLGDCSGEAAATATAKDDRLECPICNQVLATEKSYEDHIKGHYEGSTDNQCLLCDKRYKSMFSVFVHTQDHGSRRVPCEYCPRVFKGRWQLKAHTNKYHCAERRLLKHPDQDPAIHACTVCGKRFLQRFRLTMHMVAHSEHKDFACDQCPSRFKQLSSLKIHQLQHTGEKTLECPDCPLKFYHPKHLRDHRKRHSAQRIHECPVCGRMFSYRSGLNEHMNVHTRERSFKCDVCEKVFQKVSVLNRHKLMHQKGQFQCGECDQVFVRMDHLYAHTKLHRKEFVEEEGEELEVEVWGGSSATEGDDEVVVMMEGGGEEEDY